MMDEKSVGFCFTENSDIVLLFETEEVESSLSIPADKFVLRRASPVFKTMLDCHTFLENQTGMIKFSISGDVSVGLYFVGFLYTNKIPDMDLDSYIILLKMGHLYEVSGLAKTCEERLLSMLEPFTVCRIYQTLENVASEDFLDSCFDVMLRSAFLIFMHNRHLTLNEITMKRLLISDNLNLLCEEQALSALWQWGRVKCIEETKHVNFHTVNNILGLLRLIRWGFVTLSDESSPWYKLGLQQKRKYLLTPARVVTYSAASESPAIQLNRFASELKFDVNYENSKLAFRKEGNHELILLTPSSDVVLTGFAFVIGQRTSCINWEDRLKFLVNKVEMSDWFTTRFSSCNHYQLQVSSKLHLFTIEIEFVKPVTLHKCRFNVIDMRVREKSNIAFPSFVMKSNSFPLVSENPDGVLSVKRQVLSLTSLFYFVKT